MTRSSGAGGWAAHAADLVPPAARVLTHCNAGGLATGGYGSAVGAIRAAWEAGKVEHVWIDETRPLLQGARLTAFEMEALAIPYAVIVDSAAASRMAAGEIDIVITGADRIAANGDSANKIGTYGLAVLAHHHEIPFVIVAPTSTIDPGTPDGAAIPIEERDGAEVTGRFTARNPAFDVTPAGLITAIVTEEGVHRAPLRRLAAGAGAVAMILDEVDAGTRSMLERYAFDAETFDRLRSRSSWRERSRPAPNVVRGRRRGPGARRSHRRCPAPARRLRRSGRSGHGGASRRFDRDGRSRRWHGHTVRRRRQGRGRRRSTGAASSRSSSVRRGGSRPLSTARFPRR